MMNAYSDAQIVYVKQQRSHHYRIRIIQIMLLIGFLFFWEVGTRVGAIDSFIFSSPSGILACFLEMIVDHSIFIHIGVTLYETLLSFLLVTLLSILVSVFLWLHPLCAQILEPYLVILNSLPKSALAPLLIVWFGANRLTIIIAGMSVAIFGSILNIYTSFKHVDPNKLTLIYTLNGTKYHALTKIVLPYNLASILNTLKVNIGLCLVGVIIGEFIGGHEGLGYLIIYGSQVFKLDWLLMSIMLLCILAMVLYCSIELLEKKITKRFVQQ